MSLQERIKQLRKEKGLTQKQLAGKLGVSSQAIAFWESGRNDPRPEWRKKLSQFFNVSEAELFGALRVCESTTAYNAHKILAEKLNYTSEALAILSDEDWETISSVLDPLVKKLLQNRMKTAR